MRFRVSEKHICITALIVPIKYSPRMHSKQSAYLVATDWTRKCLQQSNYRNLRIKFSDGHTLLSSPCWKRDHNIDLAVGSLTSSESQSIESSQPSALDCRK